MEESKVEAEIARALNADGIRTDLGREWTRGSVRPRRRNTAVELIREVRRLKARGCTAGEIGRKLGLESGHIRGILHLLEHGEERLVRAVERGRIPLTIAILIASSKDEDTINGERS